MAAPIETISGPAGEVRSFTTAGGGTALSSTAVLLPLPLNTRGITLTPRNFSGAAVVRWAKNPFLTVLITSDAGVSFTDLSAVVQDFSNSGVATLNSFDTLANGDAIYIGSHEQFRGVRVDVTNTNSSASVLTVEYWNGSAWVTASATDGSDNGGATFGVDGNVTWTVPTDWTRGLLSTILGVSTTVTGGIRLAEDLFWTRWKVSAAFDATVTVANLLALNRSTAYAEMVQGQAWEEHVNWGADGYGCIEALTDAGTANLIGMAETRGGRFT